MKKIIAIVIAIVLVLSLASCSNNKDEYKQLSDGIDYVSKKLDMVVELLNSGGGQSAGDFTPSDDGEFIDDGSTDADSSADDSAADDSSASDSSSNSSASSSKSSSSSSKSSSSNSSNADANTLANAVAKYVAAAKATDKNVKVTITKSLSSIKVGGLSDTITKLIKSVANSVLADHSGTETGVRGNPDLITVNDFSSYKMSNDGTNTSISFVVKNYTATATGRSNEGSVGHVIGVLDTLSEATEPMGMETVSDTSNVRLAYKNAKVTCKINNKTGKLVSAKWEYDVDVSIPDNKVKFKGFTLNLKDAAVVIHYQAVL